MSPTKQPSIEFRLATQFKLNTYFKELVDATNALMNHYQALDDFRIEKGISKANIATQDGEILEQHDALQEVVQLSRIELIKIAQSRRYSPQLQALISDIASDTLEQFQKSKVLMVMLDRWKGRSDETHQTELMKATIVNSHRVASELLGIKLSTPDMAFINDEKGYYASYENIPDVGHMITINKHPKIFWADKASPNLNLMFHESIHSFIDQMVDHFQEFGIEGLEQFEEDILFHELIRDLNAYIPPELEFQAYRWQSDEEITWKNGASFEEGIDRILFQHRRHQRDTNPFDQPNPD